MIDPFGRVDELVRSRVVSELRRQVDSGEAVLRLTIDDAEAGFSLNIDPRKPRFNSDGYAPYAKPMIKDDHPLYRWGGFRSRRPA